MRKFFLLGFALVLACVVGAPAVAADCNNNGIDDSIELYDLSASTAANSCGEAMQVGPTITYAGTTVGATNDGAANCGASSLSPDVWYAYTPAASGTALISLCGSSYDTVLSLHAGCGIAPIACNDDSCSLQSTLTVTVVEGQEYLIRVSGYNGEAGAFQLTIDGPPSFYGAGLDVDGDGELDDCGSLISAVPTRPYATFVFNDAPPTQVLTINASTTATVTLTASTGASWLDLMPEIQSFDGSTTVAMSFDPSAYNEAIQLTDFITLSAVAGPTSSTLTLPVTFNLIEPVPQFVLSPTGLSVTARQGDGPTTRALTVRNATGRVAQASTADSATWLSIAPAGLLVGNEPTTTTVTFTPGTLGTGSYSGVVGVFFAANPNQSSQFVTANLTILPPDCNGNGIDDPEEVASGAAADCNANGIPDSCELNATTDANGNGKLDVCEPALYASVPFADNFLTPSLGNWWQVRGKETAVSRVDEGDTLVRLEDRNGAANRLFAADFESDQSEAFGISTTSGNGIEDYLANFSYDYTTYNGTTAPNPSTTPRFIPRSPGAASSDRFALRLEVNQRDATGSPSGVTAVPVIEGTSSLRDFRLVFDAFTNFCGQGSASGGTASGTGTTEFLGAGIAETTATPLAPLGDPTNGWFWAMSVDGGSTTDYDYYESTRDGLVRGREVPNWWNAGLGAVNGGTAPWLGFFTNPAHEQGGSPGKTWVTVEMIYSDQSVQLYFTPTVGTQAGVRQLVAEWQAGSLVGGELPGLPAITYFDPFNSVAGSPADQFALIDNVKVFDGPGDDIPSENHLTLGLNLEGQSGPVLTYRARVYTASSDEPLVGPQRDEVAANAVLISTDLGANWYEIASLRQPTGGFSVYEVPLDPILQDLGLVYTPYCLIRFSQTGTASAPAGGYDLDYVKVLTPALQTPRLETNSGPLDFEIVEGESIPDASFGVFNGGLGTIDFTVTSSAAWATPIVTAGSTSGEEVTVPVRFATADLGIGSYAADILFADAATSTSLSIPVSLRVRRPTTVDFNFDTASLPWSFLDPQLPQYAGVVTSDLLTTGSYKLSATGKVAVGFLESPVVSASTDPYEPAPEGGRAVLADSDALYEVAWDADLLPAGFAAPAIRFRASSLDFHRSDMLVVSPELKGGSSLIGGGSFPIGPTFHQVFPAPSVGSGEPMRLFLDVINASDADAQESSVILKDAVLRSAGQQSFSLPLGTPTRIMEFNLRNNNPSEFQAASPGVFTAPELIQFNQDGLLLAGTTSIVAGKANAELTPLIVGWWESPLVPFTQVAPGTLVRVRWTMTTTAQDGQQSAVPPFRLRTNSNEIVFAYMTMIDSMADGAGIPIEGESMTYDQYFVMEDNVTEQAGTPNARSLWSFAFDYIYTPDRDDDPSIGVILQGIEVDAFPQ
ncbi:hypothetical protein GC173_04965 [bacterium]|nr:hypothetical protein [bacterium]